MISEVSNGAWEHPIYSVMDTWNKVYLKLCEDLSYSNFHAGVMFPKFGSNSIIIKPQNSGQSHWGNHMSIPTMDFVYVFFSKVQAEDKSLEAEASV